jgi:hypothetical protein
MISVVMTSFNRFDLLKRTIEGIHKFVNYPIQEFFIIEDSGSREIAGKLIQYISSIGSYNYPFRLIFNETNLGAYESIDKVYDMVKTTYVLHVEDDWEFTKGGFIEPALKVLKSDASIMQVNFTNDENMMCQSL